MLYSLLSLLWCCAARVVLDVTQALGEGADMLATFPKQGHVFQRILGRVWLFVFCVLTNAFDSKPAIGAMQFT